METIHFGWDGIVDGKKKDGTDVQPAGVFFHKTGAADSEKLGYSKTLPVLEIMETAKETSQQGVRIFFANMAEANTFKADVLDKIN